MSAVRGAGTAWQPPVTLSLPNQHHLDAHNLNTDVAVNARGDAIAVWNRSRGDSYIIEGSVRAAGDPWQPPAAISQELEHAGTDGAKEPSVVIDAQGNGVVVWSDTTLIDGTGTGIARAASYTK
jgi:hypothetical protein